MAALAAGAVQCRSRAAPACARPLIQPSSRVTSTKHTNPMMSGQYTAANTTRRRPRKPRRACGVGATRRRAARPARLPTGTPTQPAAGGPGGTRTETGSAAADPRDGWGDRSRTGRRSIPRTAGGLWKKQSSQLTFIARAAVRHPVLLRKARPRRRPSKRTSPPSCNVDFRKSQEVHTWGNPCKQRDVSGPRGNVAQFP